MVLSIPVVQSRLLRSLVLAYAALCAGMGVACLAGWPGPLRWQYAIGAVCLLAGIALLRSVRVPPTARRLDLSGTGSLVLTVQLKGGRGAAAEQRLPVQLLPESTLWPGLLVLRLRGPPDVARAVVPTLVLLPDSVPAGEFRRLVVALRAMAGRQIETLEEQAKKH